MVAVMSFSGYDIEDAIVLNKASLDRGFGRCQLYRRQSVVLKSYSDNMMKYDRLMGPMVDPESGLPRRGHEV